VDGEAVAAAMGAKASWPYSRRATGREAIGFAAFDPLGLDGHGDDPNRCHPGGSVIRKLSLLT